MDSKLIDADDLYNVYLDYYGRVTLYPKSFSDAKNQIYDNENPNLFSGQAAILLTLCNLYDIDFKQKFNKIAKFCEVMPGLHQRQPVMEPDRHTISHDEHNGLCMLSVCNGDIKTINEIIEYGEKHGWVFADEKPGAKLSDNLLWYIWRVRQPRDRAFYRLCAGKKAGLIGVISLAVSSILSALKPIEETSGKNMSWFRFKTLQLLNHPSFILKHTEKLFNWILRRKYKKYYFMEECIKIYFKDPNHPFHGLIKGLK